jgi:hypothetical protein
MRDNNPNTLRQQLLKKIGDIDKVLKCSLTNLPLTDPIVLICGHAGEQATLQASVKRSRTTCCVCHAPFLPELSTHVNQVVKKIIIDFEILKKMAHTRALSNATLCQAFEKFSTSLAETYHSLADNDLTKIASYVEQFPIEHWITTWWRRASKDLLMNYYAICYVREDVEGMLFVQALANHLLLTLKFVMYSAAEKTIYFERNPEEYQHLLHKLRRRSLDFNVPADVEAVILAKLQAQSYLIPTNPIWRYFLQPMMIALSAVFFIIPKAAIEGTKKIADIPIEFGITTYGIWQFLHECLQCMQLETNTSVPRKVIYEAAIVSLMSLATLVLIPQQLFAGIRKSIMAAAQGGWDGAKLTGVMWGLPFKHLSQQDQYLMHHWPLRARMQKELAAKLEAPIMGFCQVNPSRNHQIEEDPEVPALPAALLRRSM